MRGDRGVPVRLRFTKRGRVRFISHRDVARAFDRALRMAEAPLAFTEGFVPRPRVSFGLALPTGSESDAEYLDAELTEVPDLDGLVAALDAGLPEGMAVTGSAFLEPRAASLQEAVTSASYELEVLPGQASGQEATLDPSDVEAWVSQALAADRLEGVRRRKGKEVIEDLRPAIRHLAVMDTTSKGVRLYLEVSTQPRSVRPQEVLAATAPVGAIGVGTIVRNEQWIERDGSRLTPLEADTRLRAEVGA